MRLQRLRALIRKETIQMLRDRRAMLLILGLPLVQLFLFAYAFTLTVYHLPMAVVDQSRDAKSRAFVQALVNSQYFDWTLQARDQADLLQQIDSGAAKVGLVIPPNFAAESDRNSANVLFLFDGSDSASVQSGYSAASLVAQQYAAQISSAKVARLGGSLSASSLPIEASTRVLYNPDQIGLWFIVPGLIGLILQTLAVQQAALIVVREREMGTIEPILATPARPIEVIISKMLPLLVLCLVATAVVLLLAVFWFGVPFQGNIVMYLWLTLLFIASSLGLGLMFSARASTQMQAYQSSALPVSFGLLMGGVIYPREAMPVFSQILGDLLPVTFFVRISRGIFSKGVGMEFLWRDTLILAFYTVVVVLIASRSFKPRLD